MSRVKTPAREGFLYHLWLEREFSAVPLKTIDGRPLEILEKGVRNYDAGPDFLDALLRIDSHIERGDIEIHPIAGDWYAHGHHRDPRYNTVILHLVTMECPVSFRTIRADGCAIPTLNLDNYLEKTAEELEVETVLQTPPSQFCGLSQHDMSTVRLVIEKAGDARFSIKMKRYFERRFSDSWDQIVYLSIFEALGYSKNQIPFRQLAEILPVEQLWSFIWSDPLDCALLKCEAYLFGAAGLLPSQQHHSAVFLVPNVKHYVADLENMWRQFPLKSKITVLKPGVWQFFRLRPKNFPTRRIAAAAMYVVRFMTDGFISTCIKIISDLSRKPTKMGKELENLCIIPSHPFWSTHYSFEESRSEPGKNECLLGRERARDIVVNVLLPALAAFADETADLRLKNSVCEIYQHYSRLHDNEIIRHMCEQIFKMSTCPDIITGARMQQGLIHLHKEMCQPEQCSVCLEKFHVQTLSPDDHFSTVKTS
ncbi:DUF2851 family protein [candidate division KSB1 bacterium]|nr:DUF2851 family protein [candidate division KSB1 bacterium]RQW05398.1 MAG: DUF2851 family protein [candidate division KSB1 bacterium]